MDENTEESEPPSKKIRRDEPDASELDETQIDHINRLPYEIMCKIFQLLYFEEQLVCVLVCTRWYTILRSKPFLDRLCYNFSHCFGLPIASDHAQYMPCALHCAFHDCGSSLAKEDQEMMQDMVRKATQAVSDDEPGPSTRQPAAGLVTPEQILFTGELPLKTFEIKGSFERMRRFFGDRLPVMKDLQHLTLSVMPKALGDLRAEDAPFWTITHETLSGLSWHLYANTNGYTLDLPALERYRVEIANDFDLYNLLEYSEQLVELEVWFYFERAMEQTLTSAFPRLRKLLMKRYDEPNLSPEPNTQVDDQSAERFVRGAPLLEDLTIDSNTVAFRIFRAVCLFAAGTLKRLTVKDVIFPRPLFLHILELKNLEFLRLENCILEEGSRLRRVDFPRLRHLELVNSGTCFRLESSFAEVRRLQYSMDSQLSRLCRHMTMLEDLELLFRTKAPIAELIREQFHSLAALPSLQTLRIDGMKTTTRPWDYCIPMPNVVRLVLLRCHLLRGNFALLPKLFPRLKELKLDTTTIAYRRLPKGVKPLEHLRRRLKSFLPNCCIIMNPDCDAEPVSMVLKQEDEIRWRWHLVEATQARVLPYGKRRSQACLDKKMHQCVTSGLT
uniref:F-box domain-containing protein n=1 Tax=Anopheles epiroticus TaxID=199890 RepID=A0A182PUS3_9DIPT